MVSAIAEDSLSDEVNTGDDTIWITNSFSTAFITDRVVICNAWDSLRPPPPLPLPVSGLLKQFPIVKGDTRWLRNILLLVKSLVCNCMDEYCYPVAGHTFYTHRHLCLEEKTYQHCYFRSNRWFYHRPAETI